MAVGDVKNDLSSIGTGLILQIKPPSGEEWVIHNLYWGNAASIKVVRGADSVTLDSDTSKGGRLGMVYHVTNTQWLELVNDYTDFSVLGYDGVQTK
jgi:hypothetical protein